MWLPASREEGLAIAKSKTGGNAESYTSPPPTNMDPTYHCPPSNKNTGLVRASFEVPCHLWGVYTSDESEASRLDSRDNNLSPNSDPCSRYSDYRDALYLTETTTPNTRMLSASTPKLEKRFRDTLNIQPLITS